MTLRRLRLGGSGRGDDSGAATIEFVFLGVLILVPLFYVMIAFFSIQSNVLATTEASREAGRAFATSPDVNTGVQRAQYAVELAMKSHGVKNHTKLYFVSSGTPCSVSHPAAPDPGAASLAPDAEFVICVVNTFDIPAVPSFFEGASKTITARYTLQVERYRNTDDSDDDAKEGPS